MRYGLGDQIIGYGQLVLVVAIAPTVFGGYTVAPTTGVVNTAVLCLFGMVFSTEGKRLSMWTSAISTVMWGVLAMRSLGVAI